ncbi:DUF1461 domain-containing protein [Candidatus Woesearchaeota archaeon]|nr:DUF1461 domain-containing protein [Candidatus Woesearchaeota archaeon]
MNTRKLLISFSSLLFIIIIFFSSLFISIYNIDFYKNGYEKYDIYNLFGKDKTIDVTENLIGYFMEENQLDNEFFNEKEKSHLLDVKYLIKNSYKVYLMSIYFFILSLFFLLSEREFLKNISSILFFSGIGSITLLVLAFVVYNISGFNHLFHEFHVLFFAGNYSFDPRVSNLKAMYPDGFFLDMGMLIVFNFFAGAVLSFVTGIFGERLKLKE